MEDIRYTVTLTEEEISLILEGLGAVGWWGRQHQLVVALRRRLKAL